MAHKNNEQIQAVISSIRNLQATAKENLQIDLPNVYNRLNATLLQQDNFLSHLAGTPLQEAGPRKKFGPIVMEKKAPEPQQEVKSAAAMEADQLKAEIDEILPDFPNRDAAELLDALTEMQIRGIARRAGIKVTEEEPETITLAFVEQIKAKITKDREQKKIVDKGQKNIDQPKKQKKGAF